MKILEIECKPKAAKPHQEQRTTAFAAAHKKENVSNDSASVVAATDAAAETKTTATTTPKMTDERNNNNTSNNNKKKKNNHNDHIITEATKIVLKNGLNGATTTAVTAATATALLTAAAAATVINLPPPPPPLPTHTNFALYGAYPGMVAASAAPFGFSINNGNSTATTAACEAATNKHQLAVPSPTAATTTTTATSATPVVGEMAAATATQTTKALLSTTECLNLGASKGLSCGGGGGGGGCVGNATKVDNFGVIDYTLGAKNSNNNNNNHHSDIGRHPISTSNEMPRGQSYGGRLQFFKDGKFILELARSKDSEKGGWVSVPRKIFRAPSSATSSTITPTSNTSTTYPKNESSTSLSFSDDNSSIQSSPWQRDHCWKQAAPRCGISKEMSLFYQRPNQLTLSAIGLKASRRKRRRPFDNAFIPSWENIFMPLGSIEKGTNVVSGRRASTDNHHICSEVKSSSGNNSEDDTCSSSSTGTLTGADCTDCSTKPHTTTPTSTAMPAELIADHEKAIGVKVDVKTEIETTNLNTVLAKELPEGMNTSENEDHSEDVVMSLAVAEVKDESTTKVRVNGEVKLDKDSVTPPPFIPSNQVEESEEEKRSGRGEKRLKKLKTRAKLITIIQKLIDRIPTAGLLYLSKTLQPMIGSNSGAAAIPNPSNALASKISPPSSSASSPASAASRLVELQYHQQHVSPRKRILREFEKVSLEDTGTTAAGAKRSRAKGNATNSAKSSPQRVQSTSCAVLSSAAMAVTTTANGCFNKSASKPTTCVPPTSSTSTRLYSSYSIHSLLGGGGGGGAGGNTSSLNATTTPHSPASSSIGKRGTEYVSNFSNMNYQQQHHQQLANNYTDPSYLRAMLASPKSPENSCGGGNGSVGGGKSPPNSTNKKRSPPYSSPLYDNHSRSPNIPMHPNSDHSGRRSPTAVSLEPSYKIRFSAAEHNSTANSQSSQGQHQQQSFYSPYMMSPKYVAAPQASMSPNSITTASTARSPHRTPVFSAYIPTSNASSAVAANCIPTRELSPPRSATAPPRDSTPRTVPKKTASIRRQFASPSSAASPTERFDDQQQQDRKTPLNNTGAATSTPHLEQHNFQSVLSNPHHIPGPSPLAASSLHYYMYPPNAGSSSPNAVGSPASSSASAAVQAAALAAAYIPSVVPPSYYHPYISTLAALRQNPMWMHHYPGTTPPLLPPHHTAPASQAPSRLSPPFHNFPYNGVGAAATVAAAAAAAAAFGGGPIPSSHLSQVGLAHQMSMPSALAHHAAAGAFAGGPMHSPRLTDENSVRTKAGTKQTTATSIYSSSIKDEHSSDVPLNLSKH